MYLNDGNDLSELLHKVVDAQTSYIQNQLQVLNLNPQQARLLNYVGKHPGTLQKDAAAYLNRQSATVTNMLKAMEQRGYIEREIPDNNERQKRIFLLPAGKKIVAEIAKIFASLEQVISDSVPVKEQALLIEQLKKIAETVNEA